jgi:hypothetical protein
VSENQTQTTGPNGQTPQLGAPMPAKRTFKPLKECTNLEEAFASSEFLERIKASAPQHVQPQRLLRTFVTAVSKAPLLAKADLRSFVGACLTLSQVGLEPNTPYSRGRTSGLRLRAREPARRTSVRSHAIR